MFVSKSPEKRQRKKYFKNALDFAPNRDYNRAIPGNIGDELVNNAMFEITNSSPKIKIQKGADGYESKDDEDQSV